ncbi:hypothetical protein KIPB_013259 [Kipferlia bialata]|uniref:Uncharacterized protein n=1 Tax=Kipferlia bialata TaxID=797122 RepID=A0A9K3DAW0_9EUKA|nr:hypothetical protein KIPB_013259 [Kipferlia bialata]|eukprot:g13259.t1
MGIPHVLLVVVLCVGVLTLPVYATLPTYEREMVSSSDCWVDGPIPTLDEAGTIMTFTEDGLNRFFEIGVSYLLAKVVGEIALTHPHWTLSLSVWVNR